VASATCNVYCDRYLGCGFRIRSDARSGTRDRLKKRHDRGGTTAAAAVHPNHGGAAASGTAHLFRIKRAVRIWCSAGDSWLSSRPADAREFCPPSPARRPPPRAAASVRGTVTVSVAPLRTAGPKRLDLGGARVVQELLVLGRVNGDQCDFAFGVVVDSPAVALGER